MDLKSIKLDRPEDDAPAEEKKPTGLRRVFIVGCRRSGTTWTMLLLAHHPDVVALQQLDFFRQLDRFGRWFKKRDEYGSRLLTSKVKEGVHVDEKLDGLYRFPLDVVLTEEPYYTFARSLAKDVYGRLAARHPSPVALVEQTPEYVQIWEEILKIFPHAWFLHVVRDPRSVFCSQRSAAKSWADPLRFSCNPLAVAEEWCRDVTRARKIQKATPRYLEIRYETLRREPENGLRQILEWLEMPASEELCRSAVAACSIDKMKKSSHAPLGFFRKGEADGWREEMSQRDLHAVEYVAGNLMLDIGYPLELARPLKEPRRHKLRRFKKDLKESLASWAWHSKSPLRAGASGVLKRMPALRKLVLKKLQKPDERRAA